MVGRVRAWFALVVWLAGLAICAWLVVTRVEIVFDITRFLPRDDPAVLLLDEIQASQSGRLLFIGIEGGTEGQRAAASAALAGRLRATGLFSRVDNGTVLGDDAQAKALFGYRYLLSPSVSAARFTEAGLRTALQQGLRVLRSPMSIVEKRLLPQDPTAEMQSLLRLWLADRHQPMNRSGVWFSPDGNQAVLLAESRAAGFDVPGQKAAIAAVGKEFTAINGESKMSLRLGGPSVLTVSSQDRIRGDVERLSLAASILIVCLLSVAYRAPRAVVLSVLPLISAILVGATVTYAIFGYVHGITFGFAITLLGVCVDYPIILMSFARGHQSVRQRLRQIAPLQRLCVTLTATGYLALISPAFPALSQLGVFAASGLITAMAVTRWVLPAFLPERWNAPATRQPSRWLQYALRARWRWSRPLALTGGVTVLVLLTIHPPRWENDIAALSPIPRDMLEVDQQLRSDLGAPEAGHFVVIHGEDLDDVLSKSEMAATILDDLVAAGAAQGYDAPSQFLPSRSVQRNRQAALPIPDVLRAAMMGAVTGLPFQPGLFEPFLADVEAARTGPLVQRDDLMNTPLGNLLGSLAFARNNGWSGLIMLRDVTDADAIAAAFHRTPIDGVHFLAVRQETNRLLNTFREEALWHLAFGGGVIVILLALGLRSWSRMGSVLLPLFLSLLLTIAVLRVLDQGLTLFHIVSLLLVTGIAIDYAIFFSQPEDDSDYAARALHAMLLCCITTVTSFGLLALSAIPVLQAIGMTATIGVAANFLLAFLLARPRHISVGSSSKNSSSACAERATPGRLD
ncbi:MAG: MMPL family transporter [Rhodospirillales bacterium]|nr:MMPL family transporter [Rhodospirillales bacterium]